MRRYPQGGAIVTPKYVKQAFKSAGFKLTNGGHGNRCWQYRSSFISVRFITPRHECDKPSLTVYVRYTSTDFESVADALRFINAKMTMQVIAGNDFALNTGPMGKLRLVA